MKDRFRQDFDGNYTYLEGSLHCASALDPCFKDLAFLDDSDAKDMVFIKITTEVVQMNGEVKTLKVRLLLQFRTNNI